MVVFEEVIKTMEARRVFFYVFFFLRTLLGFSMGFSFGFNSFSWCFAKLGCMVLLVF